MLADTLTYDFLPLWLDSN